MVKPKGTELPKPRVVVVVVVELTCPCVKFLVYASEVLSCFVLVEIWMCLFVFVVFTHYNKRPELAPNLQTNTAKQHQILKPLAWWLATTCSAVCVCGQDQINQSNQALLVVFITILLLLLIITTILISLG